MNFIKTVIDNKIKFSLKDQDSCPSHYVKFLEFTELSFGNYVIIIIIKFKVIKKSMFEIYFLSFPC